MKRFVIAGLMLLGLGYTPSFAQSKNYDDIYYSTKDAERDAAEQKKIDEENERKRQEREAARRAQEDANGNYSYNSSSSEDDAYIDYDDDSYYSNRFRRFGYGSFYNPYWGYDPWYGYGGAWGYGAGWGWGYQPGWSVGVGWGGPYWSSYWGWSNWYGYPGFYSYWNYPGYAWGGWGSYGGGYYNGYWDGYYSGMYGGGAGYGRAVTYGPRTSLNRYSTSPRSSSGLRQAMGTTPTGNPRAGLREAPANTNNGVRSGNAEPMRSGDRTIGTQRDGNRTITAPRGGLPENRGTIQTAPAGDRPQPVQPQRGRFFNSNEGGTIESRPQTMPSQQMEQQRYEAPRQQQQQQQRYEAPRQQQQPQQRYEQPRYEQRSAPTRSYDNGSRGGFGGGRSGGGFSGGSGGGSRSSGGRR